MCPCWTLQTISLELLAIDGTGWSKRIHCELLVINHYWSCFVPSTCQLQCKLLQNLEPLVDWSWDEVESVLVIRNQVKWKVLPRRTFHLMTNGRQMTIKSTKVTKKLIAKDLHSREWSQLLYSHGKIFKKLIDCCNFVSSLFHTKLENLQASVVHTTGYDEHPQTCI